METASTLPGDRARTSGARIVIFASMIFVSGVVSGVLGTVLFARSRIQSTLSENPEKTRALGRKVVLNFLDRKLDLDAAQRDRFEQEIAGAQEDFAILRRKISPETKALLELRFKRMNELLSPEQRTLFEALHRTIVTRIDQYAEWGEKLARERDHQS